MGDVDGGRWYFEVETAVNRFEQGAELVPWCVIYWSLERTNNGTNKPAEHPSGKTSAEVPFNRTSFSPRRDKK